MSRQTKRRRNKTISRRMRQNTRQCPKCKRKNAIKKIQDDMGITRWCRYKSCDYDSFYMFK